MSQFIQIEYSGPIAILTVQRPPIIRLATGN